MSRQDETGPVTLHRAEIVFGLPGGGPRRDGAIVVDATGRVLEAGMAETIGGHYDQIVSHQILMPGVLNCHVHMTDANISSPLPGGDGLIPWVRSLLASRRNNGVASGDVITGTLLEMQRLGTVAIGEVVNDRSTLDGIRSSGIRCRYIHELLAFRGSDADARMAESLIDLPDEDRISGTIGLHAPYSVSGELHRLAADWSVRHDRFIYEHLAEDPAERELYRSGSGEWRSTLQAIGAWHETWNPSGVPPIEHLDSLGILNERYIAVHLADATAEEIELLSRRGVRAILSPRSNLHITGLFPPVDAIVSSGMRFALGTDGRGSSPTIDVFDEAVTLLQHGANIPPGRLLEALTIDGAAILQMPDLGHIAIGNRPGLLSVEIADLPESLESLEREIILTGRRRRVDSIAGIQ